jgi:hypothetical protein
MWQFLKRLFFGKPKLTPEEAVLDKDPMAVATVMDEQDGFTGKARASDVAQARVLHGDFVAKVCVQPGVRLVVHLQASGAEKVVDWFWPETPEPEPKALAQLFVDLAQKGETLSEQPGFDVFVHGRWSEGGGSSDVSYEAMQHLAKAIGKPINIFFQQHPRNKKFQITKIEPEKGKG